MRERSFVAGRRERVALALDQELVLVVLAVDLGPLLLVHLGLGDVLGLRRGVGGRRHLIGVVGVQARRDPLFLGQAGEPVVVDALGRAAVLATVPVEPLGKLARILLRHRASCRFGNVWTKLPGGSHRAEARAPYLR
jgi:hypothetical protein